MVNVCNFPAPVGDDPALLSFDNVVTLFHEFGHAMHGTLTDVKYGSMAGTSGPRDFIELPSQLLEHWASEPQVLKSFATHYETGEPIPDELIEKLFEQVLPKFEKICSYINSIKLYDAEIGPSFEDIDDSYCL